MHRLDPVIVDNRFRGPDGMGNGGYVSGLVAEAVGGRAAKIRLHAPTPLDREIALMRDDKGARLVDGDTLLVEGEPLGKPLDLDPIPAPPDDAAIAAARARFPTPAQHMAPRCFVCGPLRDPAEALHLITGHDEQSGLAADRWTPRADLADADGLVATRYVWAALDCPSYFATGLVDTPALLAGLAARVERRPAPGERLTVTGWPLEADGRKLDSGSVIHDAERRVVAIARALWIRMDAGL
ncbi:hypothetical protein [Sphingomicrobium astaxanthinifaciens]|uniref:hypothetical protein n=1 Tax=Sphingomicrobium astaxanthinifaciens TaxID=1227949 RepID=UPI001FCA56D5|nr:hypothetical protein [Sphingomicrobium astaxanthinifaciens]MCJ7421418.1 hypothetical protein [Sphingomicrobium astaxanthinifaciens]